MIYLFTWQASDSIIHPTDHLPLSIFGFQMFNIQQCCSSNGAAPLLDHRVCGKDGEINLSDINVSQSNHVQKAEESSRRP